MTSGLINLLSNVCVYYNIQIQCTKYQIYYDITRNIPRYIMILCVLASHGECVFSLYVRSVRHTSYLLLWVFPPPCLYSLTLPFNLSAWLIHVQIWIATFWKHSVCTWIGSAPAHAVRLRSVFLAYFSPGTSSDTRSACVCAQNVSALYFIDFFFFFYNVKH